MSSPYLPDSCDEEELERSPIIPGVTPLEDDPDFYDNSDEF